MKPEEKSRLTIDKKLIESGWVIGHFFARKKEEYEITYSPEVAPPIQVSASKLKEYFNLINTAVVQIDQHLHVNFIGYYDVLKYFYFHMRKNDLVNENPSILARELRKQMGRLGMQTVGKEYYSNLLDYFALQDEKCLFKYSRKNCVKIINGRLKESNIIMQEDGENRDFSDFHFRLFCKIYNVKKMMITPKSTIIRMELFISTLKN